MLIRVAEHRWPVELRSGLRREWEAELHVLGEGGRRAAMLRFAASLAARRSGVAGDRAPFGSHLLRSALPLLVAPLVCIGVIVAGLNAMGALVDWVLVPYGGAWAFDLQLPILTMLVAASAVGLAVIADRLARGVRTNGWRAVVGITAPIPLAVAIDAYATGLDRQELDSLALDVPALALWISGLMLVLRGASVMASRGRVRAAWLLGAAGALVIADLAIVLAVFSHGLVGAETVINGIPQGDGLDPISAPLWLFVSYTGSALGLPRPTDGEIFIITDDVFMQPLLFLACTPYALAWAIRVVQSPSPARPLAAPTLATTID
ncbi:hypothetical protein [Asanoa ishikariensis]|nr:hypothetical protein [Asanoa ishikariensis]